MSNSLWRMSDSALETIRNFQRRDIVWTDTYLSRTPFHAGFWGRKRLDDAIRSHAHLAKGVLLDVGCGMKPYEEQFSPLVDVYFGLEYSPDSGYRGNAADLCGDAAALPLNNESVDTILCTEVLEHVPDPERTIAEFSRVLRPGGTLITTAPFVFPIHDKFDFFRYSPDGLAVMMSRHSLTVAEVKPLSGTAVTLAMMFNLYLFDAFMWTKWLYPFGLVLRPVLWVLYFLVNLLGRIFEVVLPSKSLSFDHLTVAKKA